MTRQKGNEELRGWKGVPSPGLTCPRYRVPVVPGVMEMSP